MLSTTINSYLYQQYADDDDLQAFVASFNQATQAYVTWFSTVALPYYPGLTGDLLDWVAEGLYGQTRTTLASPASAALGMLNTEPLNTATLNSYVPSTQTYYALTDDVFQRILTWNFYKGDGKRFCTRFLKRRVMRFLIGVNGIDPNPVQPGFVVGAENTSPISVHISGGVLTVSINQVLLSTLTQVTPGILTLFQLAFTGGALDLPVQYTYAVAIQTVLTASVTPNVEHAVGSGASQTTGTSSVSTTGGSGSYTFVWTWQAGGAGISINSPAAAQTTFTASGLANGSGVSGTALCTVTDTTNGHTAPVTVSVSFERSTAPVAAPSPNSLTVTGATSSVATGSTTVTVTGGVAPYTYAWGWQTGGTGIIINSPATATTIFTGSGMAPSQTDSGTALCTVTDHFGQQATCTVPVSISRVVPLAAGASPPTLSTSAASASETTSTCSITASGGQAPYTYQWNWQTGGVGIAINSPAASATTFTGTGLAAGGSHTGTAVCTVKDSLGQIVAPTCGVTIARVTGVSATVTPTSEVSTSVKTSQTTGVSTVIATGGSGSYTYAWSWSSGGAGLTINSATSNATSFSGSGLVAGNTYTGVARCLVTDGFGQSTSVTVSVSLSCLASTYSFTNQAATAIAIPNGATQMSIEGWADGGQGGNGFGTATHGKGGGGGGAGGKFFQVVSLTSASWDKTINISSTIGNSSANPASLVISSGTFALGTLTANRGATGADGTATGPGAGGLGGSASGGATDTTGGAGTAGADIEGGAGGTPPAGIHGGPFGRGGGGGDFSGGSNAGLGSPGGAVFFFS